MLGISAAVDGGGSAGGGGFGGRLQGHLRHLNEKGLLLLFNLKRMVFGAFVVKSRILKRSSCDGAGGIRFTRAFSSFDNKVTVFSSKEKW